MTELTPAQVRAGIVPRADQLNAGDLIASPVTVTIEGVRAGDSDHPWFVDLVEYPKRPYKPGVMMRRLMVAVLGDKPKTWIGQQMTLYRDPQVKFKGETVGGIRISHFSALSEPLTVQIAGGRGKEIEWAACPLTNTTPEDQEYIDGFLPLLKQVDTLEALTQQGEILKTKSKAIRDALRPAYLARHAELTKQGDTQ